MELQDRRPGSPARSTGPENVPENKRRERSCRQTGSEIRLIQLERIPNNGVGAQKIPRDSNQSWKPKNIENPENPRESFDPQIERGRERQSCIQLKTPENPRNSP